MLSVEIYNYHVFTISLFVLLKTLLDVPVSLAPLVGTLHNLCSVPTSPHLIYVSFNH